jgi:hypothetical protein
MNETTKRYTTMDDVIAQAVIPALGEYGHQYNAEAIAREAYSYRVDTDEQGRELLNTAGFEQVVDDEEFWQIVERHEITTADQAKEPTMSTTDTTTALALIDALDRHYITGTRPALPAAMAELGITDTAVAAELLTRGAELQYARDHGLDELAQLALVLSLDAVRADRLAAYAQLRAAHVAEWAPEVAAGGETTVAALTEMLAYVTRGTDYGTLTDCVTGEQIRPATAAEHARSLAAGETGAFELDGRGVFVAGGPES